MVPALPIQPYQPQLFCTRSYVVRLLRYFKQIYFLYFQILADLLFLIFYQILYFIKLSSLTRFSCSEIKMAFTRK